MKHRTRKPAKRWLVVFLCLCMIFPSAGTLVSAAEEPAEETPACTDGICEHHPEHTEDCGYVEAVEGKPCQHEHTEECYAESRADAETPAEKETPVCNHAHDESCGYTPPAEGTPCTHEHTEECFEWVTECVHEHTEECYEETDGSTFDNTAAPSNPEERKLICDHECSGESGCITKKNVCQHEHDSECGYSEGTEGTPCTHTHNEGCGYLIEEESGQNSGENEIVLICPHANGEHDDTCGYVEAVEGRPCIYATEGCLECRKTSATENTDIQENISAGQLVYTLRPDATAVVTGGKKDSSGYIVIPAQIQVNGEMYTVTEVAEEAFYDYSGAKGITLPETLLVIGEKAFYGAAVVTGGGTLEIPDSVIEIGKGAFAQNDFGRIIVGEGLTEIPSGAFAGVSFLTDDVEVILGGQITAIAADAFDGGTVTKVTVKGETGRLDAVLEQVNGLKKAEIIYDDPKALTSEGLQQQIDAAKDGEPVTIVIDEPVTIEETVKVPAGKDITLIDDGTTHTLISETGEMFRVEGKLTVSSTSEASRLVFRGGTTAAKEAGNIAAVVQGGELILKDAVFCGGKLNQDKSGGVYVGKNAVFTMTGGVIEDFSASRDMTGSVLVVSGGNFQLSGGVIQNNKNDGRYYTSGGVLLYTWYSDDADAEMTMSGNAVIRNNVAQNGGGVYLIGNTDFRMTGGTITENNASTGMGGGVCVAGAGKGSDGSYDTKFTMEGGTISRNSCTDSGGGIYVNSDDVILSGGRIEGNTAGRLGGGIYVSEPPQVVRIYNGIVTGNEASVMGGGLWFCPTGDATLAVTNGIAVYENRANGAGDDFVSLSGSTGRVILADRFLGGGAVEWYSDGAVIGGTTASGLPQNVTGSVDQDVPRFDPADPGDRLTGIDGSGNYALKAVVSDNAVKLAESQAKLWITGNKAARGGGIGANGAALLGEDGRDYTLQVTKEWSGNTPEKEKKEILVFLKIGGYELDAVSLNAENNWKAEFTELPDPESLKGDLQYAVVESPVPPNFTPVYQNAVIEGNKIYISVTNHYSPELTSVKTAKVWEDNSDQDGIRPESIIVKLLADGKDTKETLTLSSENNWTGSFTGLAKYQNGREIVYTVEEVSVDGYDSVITGDASAGFVITNSHTPAEIDLSGSKTWDDADNQDGKRPDSITIRLYANGVQVKVVTVTAEDGWKWSFDDLPKYENGKEIRYTITEDVIPGYQSGVDGMNVTNHYTPGQINIPVTKNWQDQEDADGIRPDSITVKLYADGEDTGRELVLNQKNNWTGSFGDLDEYADGAKIVYTIAEVEVDGYDTAISGSAETGFVISNSHAPDTPDEPDEPDKPDTPDEPGKPDDPDKPNNPDAPDKPNPPAAQDFPAHPQNSGQSGSPDTRKEETPRTGDTTHAALWIGLLALSGTGLTVAAVLGKKKRNRGKRMK